MSLKIFQLSEIFCLLLSVLLFSRLKKSVFVWSVPYLLIVVFVDVIASYLSLKIYGTNQWIFNFYLPIQNVYFSYLFYNFFIKKSWKQVVLWFCSVFIVFFIVNICFIQGFSIFNNYTFIVTACSMILFSGMALLQILQDESNALFANSFFWVAAACLIFFTGFCAFFAVYYYYQTSPEALMQMQQLYHIITLYIITAHYVLLSVALIVQVKVNK